MKKVIVMLVAVLLFGGCGLVKVCIEKPEDITFLYWRTKSRACSLSIA